MKYKATILAVIIGMAGVKADAKMILNGDTFEKLSCDTIIRNGLYKVPIDVIDYIKAKPGSDKLGYGSACHLTDLVFA